MRSKGFIDKWLGEYGFITADDGQRFHFHRTSVDEKDRSKIKQGALVSFIPGKATAGPRAFSVRVISAAISTSTEAGMLSVFDAAVNK
jgi:cold shock CspA family protein